MPTTPEGDAAPPRAARGDLGQRPIAIGLLVLIVLLAGGAASIALLGSGGSPAPGATVLDPSGGIASSPSAGLDTSADFRFLPALITPPLLPAPTAVPSASPGATPTTGSGLSFDLAPGVAAPRDSTSVWIGWTGAGGSKLKGRVTIEAGLDQGALHRVVLNPSATRILRPAQTGHDYVYRMNVSASAGAAAESVTAAFRLRSVDDRDRSIAYSGTWASAGAGGYLGGSARFSKRPGSTATLTFVGQSVAWIGPVGPRRGQATVSIDGVVVRTVSQLAGSFRPRQTLFVHSWSRPGRHTIQVRVNGRAGATVMIDSFDVLGPPVKPPVSTPPAPSPTPSPVPTPPLVSATLPLRAAFYYGWYPEAWQQHGSGAWTAFHPSAGTYDSSDSQVLKGQVAAMRYGGIAAGLASWWGPLTRTDGRMPQLLAAGHETGFLWAVNDEVEEVKDLDASAIAATLQYVADHYANDPSYLRIDGRFVVFVGAGAGDGCAMVQRWTAANTIRAYLILPAVPGYAGCSSQPDQWYASDPTVGDQQVGSSSYAISPGFWRSGESARLQRSPQRWAASVRAMVASGARLQLVGSFNQWGDGSSVESAAEWTSPSGFGTYLDVLHDNGGGVPTTSPPPNGTQPDPVLVGAGAIASCGSTNDEETAQILKTVPGTVFTVGDNAFDAGTLEQFQDCYGPSWGTFLDRTRPAVGTREYVTPDASGYFAYFGAAAGPINKGYYAYDLGKWRIYVLNSNCSKVGGCQAGSPQEAWLRADLKAHPSSCIGAYWQIARFSSGRFGDDPKMQPFWQDLYDHGAEFVINGHDHNYQRYAPMTPKGVVDQARGIREFIVGTGGNGHTSLTTQNPGIREAGTDLAYGVLQLTLHPTGYEWRFLATPKAPFEDSGAASCH